MKKIKSRMCGLNSDFVTNFQVGCNTIMSAVTAKGVTPASNSPSDISTAISNIETGLDINTYYGITYRDNGKLQIYKIDNGVENVLMSFSFAYNDYSTNATTAKNNYVNNLYFNSRHDTFLTFPISEILDVQFPNTTASLDTFKSGSYYVAYPRASSIYVKAKKSIPIDVKITGLSSGEVSILKDIIIPTNSYLRCNTDVYVSSQTVFCYTYSNNGYNTNMSYIYTDFFKEYE